jgi:hypothetical protein
MERIGFCLHYGYIYKQQNEKNTLVYVAGVGFVHPRAA